MEYKELSIYRERLKFPSIYSEEISNKFDVLITTLRLLGYAIQDTMSADFKAHDFYSYTVRAFHGSSKQVTISFGFFDKVVVDIEVVRGIKLKALNVCHVEDVVGIERFPNSNVVLNTEEDILEELEEVLVYI